MQANYGIIRQSWNAMVRNRRLLLTAVSLLPGALLCGLPHQYCMAGYGYGFPFSWRHPTHHDEWVTIAIGVDRYHGPVFDPVNLLFSLVLWLMLAVFARRLLTRSPGT